MKIKIVVFLVLSLIFCIGNGKSFGADIKINASINLKKDGSGTMELSYNAKDSEVKNYMLGNFPFGPKTMESFYGSSSSTVSNANFYKSTADNSIYVASMKIEFKDINKLKEARGFYYMDASWIGSDKGDNFKWIFKPDTKNLVQIQELTFKVTFEDAVLNSNGQKLEGTTVTWYKDSKAIEAGKEISLNATIKSAGTTTTSGTKTEEKSCGLFGLELPFMLLAGLVISKGIKRKTS